MKKSMRKKIIKPCVVATTILLLATTTPIHSKALASSTFNIGNIQNHSMKSKCGLTVDELENGLKYNLKPYAKTFIDVEDKYGVNALFLSSIASVESGHGRYMFEPNNIFGFNTKHQFRSIPECIDYVAQKIRVWYLTDPDNIDLTENEIEAWVKDENEIGQYYNGCRIHDVAINYNEATNTSYGDYIVGMAYEIYYDSI